MKKEFLTFFGILILICVAFYFVYSPSTQTPDGQPTGGKEISLDEFTRILQKQDNVAILMRFESENYKNQIMLNCTIGLARSLGALGKNVKNYAFERDYCIRPDLSNVTQAQCNSELGAFYFFEIGYGSKPTKLYERKASVYVNETFTGECGISSVNSSS